MVTIRRLAAGAAALALVCGAGACSGDGGGRATDPGAVPARPDLTPSRAPALPTTIEDFSGEISSADLLVVAPEELTDDEIALIRGAEGVTDSEQIAVSQVPVDGRALTVAAVDPVTFRRFAPVESARIDELWQRVAEGQTAVAGGLRKALGDPKKLQLGMNAGSPRVQVAAWAPQAPRIEAVVSGDEAVSLGMTPGNAMVLSTGENAPKPVREALTKRLADAGSEATVELLGPDLDTTAPQTAVVAGTVASTVGTYRYRVDASGRVTPDPAWVREHIVTADVPILGSVTCNKQMIPQLRAALQEIQQRGLADEIHTGEYGGCYNARFIAGSQTLSNHAFGLAVDLNVPGNLRGSVGEIDRAVVAIFKSWGFGWGGDWNWTDPMHFEMNALVKPD